MNFVWVAFLLLPKIWSQTLCSDLEHSNLLPFWIASKQIFLWDKDNFQYKSIPSNAKFTFMEKNSANRIHFAFCEKKILFFYWMTFIKICQAIFNNIHWLHLCRGVRPPHNECPGYDTKQSDGEVPVKLGLWGMWSTHFIDTAPRSTLARNGFTWYSPIYGLNRTNCILMLNWIVWNRPVWLNWIVRYRNVFDN